MGLNVPNLETVLYKSNFTYVQEIRKEIRHQGTLSYFGHFLKYNLAGGWVHTKNIMDKSAKCLENSGQNLNIHAHTES